MVHNYLFNKLGDSEKLETLGIRNARSIQALSTNYQGYRTQRREHGAHISRYIVKFDQVYRSRATIRTMRAYAFAVAPKRQNPRFSVLPDLVAVEAQ